MGEEKKPYDPLGWMTVAGTIAIAAFNVVALPWQLCLTVPMTFGASYIGLNAILLLAVVFPVLPALVPFENRAQIHIYSLAYHATVGLCLFHRIASLFNREHSDFVGKQALRLPGQATLAAALHFGLAGVSPQLACLLPVSFFALCVHLKLIALRDRVTRRRMRDQSLEAGHINRILRDL